MEDSETAPNTSGASAPSNLKVTSECLLRKSLPSRRGQTIDLRTFATTPMYSLPWTTMSIITSPRTGDVNDGSAKVMSSDLLGRMMVVGIPSLLWK